MRAWIVPWERGFDKVFLAPGETGTARRTLDSRAFSYWEDTIHDWYAEPGLYQVEAAASSRDIRLERARDGGE